MNIAIEILVWTAIWVTGVFLFDYWLKLTGSWLMLGGVVTYFVCDYVNDWLRSKRKVVS